MIPVSALTGVFEGGFWHGLAWLASAVAMWAQARAQKAECDPVDDLMERVRHPIRWTCRHPVVAVKRQVDRRR